jgi:hypothetical protein
MKFFNKIKQLFHAITQLREIHAVVTNDFKSPKLNLGQIQSYLNSKRDFTSTLAEVEFQVFSQWGDDGIIQYLVNNIEFSNKTFIEFGVENYKESNTRFLLLNNNWSGLVLDGSQKAVDFIKSDGISWTHDIYAKQAFITKENINSLISTEFLEKGFNSELGILSVDIDGNDYWVWNEISVVKPIVVIVEYNSFFGEKRAITIPYHDAFVMDTETRPYYWGASLKAFCLLGEKMGYYLIGCNSNGNNAYFVRKDKIGEFKVRSCEEAYVRGKFRLKFSDKGDPLLWHQIQSGLNGLPVVNVEENSIEKL